MSFDEGQQWIKDNAWKYLGNMKEFMFQLSLEFGGEDLANIATEAKDWMNQLKGAGVGDRAIVQGFATALGQLMSFEEAIELYIFSIQVAGDMPENFRRASTSNIEVLTVMSKWDIPVPHKEVVADFLGMDGNTNALAINSESFKYHPDWYEKKVQWL